MGILRVIRIDIHSQANIVPVDYCSNLTLACAWQTANDKNKPIGAAAPPIYNYVPSDHNMLTWGGFKKKAESLGHVYPLTKMIWLPILHTISTPWLFNLVAFFYHILPGYCIDVVLRLRGRTPRMLKLYQKIHKNLEIIAPFTHSNWHYETHNTQRLWQRLSAQDQQLFEFDMSSLDWDDYLYNTLGGMRIFLGKEDPGAESLERGKKKLKRYAKRSTI